MQELKQIACVGLQTPSALAKGMRPNIASHRLASQRSLHNAPIFRLLLKVAVNGTHQCDFQNFCGADGPNAKLRKRNTAEGPDTHAIHKL